MPIKKRAEPEETLPEDEVPSLFEDEQEEEYSGIGHNGGPPIEKKPKKSKKPEVSDVDTNASLLKIYGRLETLEEDRKAVAEDIKQVYAEAKSMGFDTKALRAAVAALRKDKSEREEFEDIRDFYIEVLEARV